MTRLRPASLVRCSALLAALAACCFGTGCGSGGQTGGEIPATGGCDAEYAELTLDEVAPFGASAASVLEPLRGTNTSPLLWTADTGSLTIGPEQGLSQVELTATYEGGRIAWAHFVPGDGTGAATAALACAADRLEIDLDVWLRTSGGALDERFVATLGAVAPDNAQLTMRLPLESLAGTFFVMAPAGVTAPTLRVTAVWDVFGFRGTLMGEVEYRDPSTSGSPEAAVGFGFVPYADWPPPSGTSGP